jgi:GTP-binding protein
MIEFVDEAKIWVKAGDGGNGVVAFRREKFVPKGGPSGGNGGDGGSVVLMAKGNAKTLREYYYHRHFKAESGRHGSGGEKTGACGADLVLIVPPGTVVKEIRNDREIIISDLDKEGKSVIVARGGKGGRGNAAFKSSTNQAPRIATPGTAGEEKFLKLELKLLAEAGIIGYPNAGKSTLLSKISHARPKIADYPFTTLTPTLGVVILDEQRSFVAADIPGLIEGASEGAGLGTKFLRHIERTRILVHLIDLSIPGVVERYNIIRQELGRYGTTLIEKPEIVVGTKIDLPESRNQIGELARVCGESVIISAVTGEGIRELLEKIWKKIVESRDNRGHSA